MLIKDAFLVVLLFSVNLSFAEDFRIGSWNVRCVEKSDSLAGDAWSKRVPEISKIIHFIDFDVVGIQEADSLQTADLSRFLNEFSF